MAEIYPDGPVGQAIAQLNETAPAREVEVRAAISNLHGRTEMLQLSANALIERLAPVLSPAALAAADTGSEPKPPQCALADEIDSVSVRLAATTDAIQDTLRRLEV